MVAARRSLFRFHRGRSMRCQRHIDWQTGHHRHHGHSHGNALLYTAALTEVMDRLLIRELPKAHLSCRFFPIGRTRSSLASVMQSPTTGRSRPSRPLITCKAHGDVFDGPPVPEQVILLHKQVQWRQSIIGHSRDARVGRASHQLDPSFVDTDLLPSARAQAGRLFVTLLAGIHRLDAIRRGLGKITAYIRAAQSPAEVKGLILATLSFDDPHEPQANHWAREIVKAVQANPRVTDQSEDGRFNAAVLPVVMEPLTPRPAKSRPSPRPRAEIRAASKSVGEEDAAWSFSGRVAPSNAARPSHLAAPARHLLRKLQRDGQLVSLPVAVCPDFIPHHNLNHHCNPNPPHRPLSPPDEFAKLPSLATHPRPPTL